LLFTPKTQINHFTISNFLFFAFDASLFSLFAYIKEVAAIIPDVKLDQSKEIKIIELFGEDIDKNLLLDRILFFGRIINGHLLVSERKKTLEIE
jgi:uncharacterized protein (DUF2225 family)